MIRFLPKSIRRRVDERVAAAEARAAAAEEQARDVAQRSDEVRDLSAWARGARERNHLTDLFVSSIRGS